MILGFTNADADDAAHGIRERGYFLGNRVPCIFSNRTTAMPSVWLRSAALGRQIRLVFNFRPFRHMVRAKLLDVMSR